MPITHFNYSLQQEESNKEWLNIAVLALYLVGMIAFGFWGSKRITNTADYLVAGRNLGGLLYTGTMVAVVLGGA